MYGVCRTEKRTQAAYGSSGRGVRQIVSACEYVCVAQERQQDRTEKASHRNGAKR